MVCKTLFFDYKDSDKLFFEKTPPQNFQINFFSKSLNRKTIQEISEEDLNQTAAISVSTASIVSADVINQFKNLRVISVRSKDYKNIDLKTCLNRNIAVVTVQTTDKNNEYHTLQTSFNSITGVLCGCKENRIV